MIYILPYLFTLITLLVFYQICKKFVDGEIAFYSTLLLSFFPYFYGQTLLGYVDTPHIIHLVLVLLIWLYIKIKEVWNKERFGFVRWIYVSEMFILFGILSQIWTGWKMLVVIIYVAILFDLCKSKLHYILYFIFVGISSVGFINPFMKLLTLKSYGVAEYRYVVYIPYYLIFILVVYLLYKNRKHPMSKFLGAGYFFTFILSIFIQRIASFNVVFGCLLIAYLIPAVLPDRLDRKAVLAIIICLCLGQVMAEYGAFKPVLNRPYEEALLTIPTENIVNFWDNGHIIRGVTGKSTNYIAQPYSESISLFVSGILADEEIGIKYLDQLNKTANYTLVLLSDDEYKGLYLEKYINVTISNSSIMSKSKHNESLKYYDLVSQSSFKDKRYWIYLRR